MSRKTLGYIITACIIGTLIFIMVENTVGQKKAVETPITQVNPEDAVQGEEEGLEQYSPAPDFTLETLAGETVTLSELKGKKVILNFWATWCPPCKAEMPHMESFYSKLTDEDQVELIAVNVTESERLGIDEVETFVDSYELSFPIPLDKTAEVTHKYGVISMPTTFMIDTQGRIAQKVVGPLDEKTLNELVDFMD
ncbi:thiol-disulfide oxidoreductase [Sporosarcina sp. P21c]|uniref:redoxin domain-containing protein n=1 Tax=unclassified Sporosarcina TaxID=2647733 RepID=UPI000C1629FB|nr:MULTISPECIES: redoxin domain-containing protein [unclassified Sporosarcina]PIC65901.1 thiol-disulfide oxidoreductase [Sporosarcina sp. P16a]PIC87492.1 thiol-disulfide oxidoreductase [Sporosarcina sp. P21c]PIC92013.1 thiol-disulfide oxidoreductase [Sporosarcina sp. P25]